MKFPFGNGLEDINAVSHIELFVVFKYVLRASEEE